MLGPKGPHRGKGKPERKRIPLPEWKKKRLELLKNKAFVKKALKNLHKTEPGLVELFRSIPEQITLSRGMKQYVADELRLRAIEREMFRQGLSQYGPANTAGMVLESGGKEFIIIMRKRGKDWRMVIQE